MDQTEENRHIEEDLNIETYYTEYDLSKPDNEIDPLEVLLSELNNTAFYFIRLGKSTFFVIY